MINFATSKEHKSARLLEDVRMSLPWRYASDRVRSGWNLAALLNMITKLGQSVCRKSVKIC